MKTQPSGQVLVGVLVVLLVMMILTPPLINWITKDTQWAVKQQKTTSALNLASGAVERGTWKLKSSTSTWAQAAVGTVISGYNFDVTYTDVEGGEYRIKFSSGPSTDQVTILAEARDPAKKEKRSIQAVFQDQAIPGPILTVGNVGLSGALEPHWGPAMAQGNITLSGTAASNYFPRKFSKNVVSSSDATYPRDTNGITPPNTDNLEWWSGYSVPDLPALDFATLRSSASSNGTLNYYNGYASSHTLVAQGASHPAYSGSNSGNYSGCGSWTHGCCRVAGTSTAHPNPHNTHFFDSNDHPLSKQNRIWYWDGDVSFTGEQDLAGHSNGLYGTVIVRGNMTIETEDNYSYTATIPSSAWKEYQKIDTASSNQYPGDTGFHSNAATFALGGATWTGGPASAAYTDVGFRGLIYVGGNLSIVSGAKSDFAGSVWVVGNVTNANTSEYSLVFYDSSIGRTLPVLNVILVQQTWKEVIPSSISWP